MSPSTRVESRVLCLELIETHGAADRELLSPWILDRPQGRQSHTFLVCNAIIFTRDRYNYSKREGT